MPLPDCFTLLFGLSQAILIIHPSPIHALSVMLLELPGGASIASSKVIPLTELNIVTGSYPSFLLPAGSRKPKQHLLHFLLADTDEEIETMLCR